MGHFGPVCFEMVPGDGIKYLFFNSLEQRHHIINSQFQHEEKVSEGLIAVVLCLTERLIFNLMGKKK